MTAEPTGRGASLSGAISTSPLPTETRRWRPSATTAAAAVLLLTFTALAVAYNAAVPPFEGADESTHYFYAKHVYCTGTLPVQQADAESRGLWEQEGSQPPLYYALVHSLVGLEWLEPDLDTFREPRTPCAYPDEALTYNHQNSMGRPAVVGNENRFIDSATHQARGYAGAVHFIRFASTLLGLLTLIALWTIFTRVFALRRWLAVAALALVALNPQYIHLSSTVSNDNAMNAIAAVALALLLRVLAGDGRPAIPPTSLPRVAPPGPRRAHAAAIALALVVGLAPLAKLTGLALAAFVVAALLWTAWRRYAAGARGEARRLGATAVGVAIACVALAGWWYVRNIDLYGSLTGLNIMLPPELRRDLNVARFIRGLPGELNGMWLSSWGLFGWFTILMPTWVYVLIGVAAAAAAIGGWRAWGDERRRRRAPQPYARVLPTDRHAVVLLALWWLVTFASLLRWMLIAKGAHGRLLFPAIAAPAVLLVLGWRALLPARRVGDRTLALAVSGTMAALAVGALVGVIRPAYARPATIAASALPADAVPIGVVFDEAVELVAMRTPRRAATGAAVEVTLYWRVRRAVERDGFVALRFDQEVAASDDPGAWRTVASDASLSYPGRGNAPFALLPPSDALYVDKRTLPVPPAATALPGVVGPQSVLARLVASVYEPAAGRSWPAERPDGGDGVAAVDIALDTVAAGGARRPDASAPLAVFDDRIELRVDGRTGGDADAEGGLFAAGGGIRMRSVVVPPGSDAAHRVAIRWHVIEPPTEDLSLFVHLVDADGALVSPFDSAPSAGARYPTSYWRAGEDVDSFVAFRLPDGARPGDRFALRLGLYKPADDAPRLAAIDAAGRRWTDDSVHALTIDVRSDP